MGEDFLILPPSSKSSDLRNCVGLPSKGANLTGSFFLPTKKKRQIRLIEWDYYTMNKAKDKMRYVCTKIKPTLFCTISDQL